MNFYVGLLVILGPLLLFGLFIIFFAKDEK